MTTELPIMEQFYTIQGEGLHQGRAAYFVRLGGCDVGCVWCDVQESWDASLHPVLRVDDIVAEAKKYPARLAVITGGEPLMYDLTYLTNTLQEAGFQLHVETSGAHPLSGKWDWITFSPKKFKFPVEGFSMSADELKVVVFNRHDFKWAELYAEQVSEKCQLYLQPEWGKEAEILPMIIEYVKKNPEWRISVQTHKYMNIP
jgi:7-carboxy-7-deazaguanine synthase|tara:strand:+ start:526 stop:1128 length:603 start_codon:yes stop_codon:yes gene_type:complete